MLKHIILFTGRHARDVAIKEPRSPVPSASRKRKVYSTTNANAIGLMDSIDIDFDPPPVVGKRRKAVASGSVSVQFDAVALPTIPQASARATRKSTRVSNATMKKDMSELFTQLGQQFRAIAKTCEELGEVME